MQAGLNLESSSEAAARMSQDFDLKLKLTEEEENQVDDVQQFDQDDDDTVAEEEDFSFSFAFDGVNNDNNPSQISAEEAFYNGQIKTIFPLFNRDLLLADGEDLEDLRVNDRLPSVKKVFFEADNDAPATSGDDDIAGPYCEWTKKAVEVSPEGCKKSNSTGFSKIWRFKDFMHRSNSDGRDAFVFLNNTTATTSGKREEKVAATTVEKKETLPERKANGVEGKVNVGGGKAVKKKVVKGKTAALSAHEVYMRSKAKDGDRRRSYLPYRPELVGLFTNVTGGGLSRNVHPF